MTSTYAPDSEDTYPPTWTPPGTTAYPTLRSALDPAYADASDEEISAYVEATLPGVTADELEQAIDDLGRTLGRIAPGALSGALTGLQVGTAAMPGWGSLIGAGVGALGGGLLSLLSPGGGQQPGSGGRPSPQAPRPAPRPARRPSPRPGSAPPARGPSPSITPAAAQLLALLSQPQVIQALTALALGAGGRREVTLAGAPVATTDIADTVARLAEQAAGEAMEGAR